MWFHIADSPCHDSVTHTNNQPATKPFIPKQVGGRLEMKPHELKIGTKQERKRREKTKGDKKLNQKRRKDNKTLSQKSEKRWEKTWQKDNKREGTEDQGSDT
jgi:hypothetical protein